MEEALGGCISLIYRYHDGRSVSTINYTTIERKIGFLRACAKLPSVAPHAAIIEQIADVVMREKDARNHIVHGLPIKVERNGTAHIILLRPNFETPDHILRVVDWKEWDRLDEQCWKTLARAIKLTFALLPDEVARNEVENVGSEWFVKGASLLPASKKVRDLYKELFTGDPKD